MSVGSSSASVYAVDVFCCLGFDFVFCLLPFVFCLYPAVGEPLQSIVGERNGDAFPGFLHRGFYLSIAVLADGYLFPCEFADIGVSVAAEAAEQECRKSISILPVWMPMNPMPASVRKFHLVFVCCGYSLWRGVLLNSQ